MTSARPNGPPYFLSFAQFLAAPREGRLLDELRRLPRRPLTAEEVAATAKIDEARMRLERHGVGYLAEDPSKAYSLSGAKREAWDAYRGAWEAWAALQRVMRESQQRWIYDRGVDAGVFVAPSANADPRGDLEKEEKKDRKVKDRERKKDLEADAILPESVEIARGAKFDGLKNRRFMFNPRTSQLILGGPDITVSSHAQELGEILPDAKFDEFVRGWVSGPARGYPGGIVHFAPAVPSDDPEGFAHAVQALQAFVAAGAGPKTLIRGLGGTWEQPLYKAFPELAPVLESDLVDETPVEDAALDFAEDTVGRFYFAKHWARHRNPAKLAAWLSEHGYASDPAAVLAELDRLAQAGLWRS